MPSDTERRRGAYGGVQLPFIYPFELETSGYPKKGNALTEPPTRKAPVQHRMLAPSVAHTLFLRTTNDDGLSKMEHESQ